MKNVIPGLEKIFDEENFHKNASIDLLRQENRELESYEETSLTIPKEDRNFGVVSYKTYWKYFRAGLTVYLMILLVLLSNGALGECVVSYQIR